MSKGSEGFSLIEVLIALVILAVSLLGLSAMMARTTRNTSNGGHLTEAATFAQDQLEGVKVIPYVNLNSGTVPNPPKGSDGQTTYNRVLTVVPNADDSLKTVTVTVNWTDATSRNHSISMLTVVKNPVKGVN